MNKSNNGRMHIVVKEYVQKDGSNVAIHGQGCSTKESSTSEGLYICHVCGKKYKYEDIHKIEINGKIKNICKNCAETFHVLT